MAQFDLAVAKLKKRREMGAPPLAVLKRPLLTAELLLAGWNGNHYPVMGQQLAEKLLDMADMIGFDATHELLLTAVNAMRIYPPIEVKALLCGQSLQAIRFVIARQSEVALLGAVRTAQVMHLTTLADSHPKAVDYLQAWTLRAYDC